MTNPSIEDGTKTPPPAPGGSASTSNVTANVDLLSLASDLDRKVLDKVLPKLLQNGITTVEILRATATVSSLQSELSNGLDFPEKVLLNTLCQRALGPAGDPPGTKAADVDLGDLLVQAGRRFGSLPDPGLLCSNSATLKKMKDVKTALTIDLTECHPRSDLSHGVDIDTGNFSNCTQLLPSIFLAVDKDSRRKITSFSDFSASFLRYAVTLVVHFPMQESGESHGVNDKPQVGLLDLLAYWKRLYDVAVPLTVNGVVAFDKEYRSQLALKVAQHSVTLSDGFAQDCVPGLLASYLARFSQVSQPRATNQSRSGGQSRNKSTEVCRHFLRGTCHYGRSCRFSHISPGSLGGGSSGGGRQGQGPYSRQESSDGKGASGNGAPRPKGPLVSSCNEVSSGTLFQDGSGLPVQLDELYSRSTQPSADAVKFLALLSGIVDEYKLPEVLQSNLSPEGGLAVDSIGKVKDAFDTAANELRLRVAQHFGIDDRTALVGGPLRPGVLDLLSKLFDPESDSHLSKDLNNGVSLGFSIPLKESGVFPSRVGTISTGDEGFDEVVLRRLGRSFRNYTSAQDRSDQVLTMIREEVREGRMRELTELEKAADSRCYSKIAAIPKGVDSLRLVEDFRRSKANSLINLVERVCLPRLCDIVSLVRRVCYSDDGTKQKVIGTIVDIKGAYRLVGIEQRDRRFCSVMVEDANGIRRAFEHLMMPFGVPSAPWNFSRLSSKALRIIREILRLLSLRLLSRAGIMVYIDDFLFLLLAGGAVRQVSLALVVLLLIGLLVAWEKLRVSTTSVKYVGFVVTLDTSPVTISVPEAKLSDTLRLISSVIASRHHVSINVLEKVAGRLVWLCRFCEFARPYLSPLYERLGIARKFNQAFVAVSDRSALFKALKWWENTLRVDGASYGEFRLSMPVFPPGALSPIIYIASDASISGLGAWATCGERTCWFNLSLKNGRALGKWKQFLENPAKPSSSDMVFLETLAAALGLAMALQEFESDSPYRSWISLRSDNAGTVASFKKLRSSTPRINEVLRSLACRLAKISYRFDACYVSSEENYYADIISRASAPSKYLPATWERVVVLPSALKCDPSVLPTLTKRSAASISKQRLPKL